MITSTSLTNGSITVIIDNGSKILTARNDHPKWKEIVETLKANDESRLLVLLSLKAVIEEYSIGALSVTGMGVLYRGQVLHSIDADRVMAFLRDGLPYKPIANYMNRKMANPSARAIKEMYNFLEHKNMTLTPDGTFIAYKGVTEEFYSVHGNKETKVIQGTVDENGRILNTVGSIIEVERSSVDDDFRIGCSFGLHAGSLAYAKGWAKKVLLVEIDPADVVSVPSDCDCQKLRCSKYKVVGEYTGPMPDTYTEEFSKKQVPIHYGDFENEEEEEALIREEVEGLEAVQGQDAITIAWFRGKVKGSFDRHNGNPPEYVLCDENGADTDIHCEFIKGYIHGYEQ